MTVFLEYLYLVCVCVCVCVSVIDVQAFERLLGSCKQILKRNIWQYEQQLEAVFGSRVDDTH